MSTLAIGEVSLKTKTAGGVATRPLVEPEPPHGSIKSQARQCLFGACE
jgi:hypothetical protein